MVSRARQALMLLAVGTVLALGLHGATVALAGSRATLGTLPEFSLVERDGRAVTLDSLRGKVSVMAFIFTGCGDSCPLQIARMAQLQRALAGRADLRFIAVTVDPEHDTPAVMRSYAGKAGVDRPQWLFLTGAPETVRRFLGQVPLGSAAVARTALSHVPGVLVIDRETRIRAYYDPGNTRDRRDLQRDLVRLLHGTGGGQRQAGR